MTFGASEGPKCTESSLAAGFGRAGTPSISLQPALLKGSSIPVKHIEYFLVARIEEDASGLPLLSAKINHGVMGAPVLLMATAPVQYAHIRPDGVLVVPPGCLRP